MEQCVARLDVAMFNAILRESDDEMPTDPVSDPISDPRVLPIPAGKSSFGAGAQLKNVVCISFIVKLILCLHYVIFLLLGAYVLFILCNCTPVSMIRCLSMF